MLTRLQRTLILCTMMMGTFITAMSVTVTATMLPAIIADYHIPAQTAQWLTSGATLVSGIMIPIAAYLMKRFPSKAYFLMAMAVFCAGALLGSLAQNFPVLLAGRFIQAAGCGMLMPFSQIVLMAVYPKNQHGSVMGIYALGSTVASVISPTLAGFVIDQLGWQAVFWIFTAVGIAVFMLGCFFMKNVMETYHETFPLLPVILSSIGFCGLLVGFGNLNQPFFRLESGGALGLGLAFQGNTGVLQIGITSCLLSAGAGCLNTPTTTMALSGMKGKDRVDASSILNTLRQISSAMATTLAILVYSIMSGFFGDIVGVKSVYMMFAGMSIAAIAIVVCSNRALQREYSV